MDIISVSAVQDGHRTVTHRVEPGGQVWVTTVPLDHPDNTCIELFLEAENA
jgi:hypothetical protein